MNSRKAHTFSKIPRVTFIAVICGINVCNNRQRCKQAIRTFRRTRPTLSATEAPEEIGDKMDAIILIDLKILSRCWKLSMACAWPCSKIAISSAERQSWSPLASECSESANVTPSLFSYAFTADSKRFWKRADPGLSVISQVGKEYGFWEGLDGRERD